MVNATPIVHARSEEHLWHSMSLGGGIGREVSSGAVVTPSTAMGYPPLWRAINLISGSVAGLPFNVFKRQRGGGKKVDLRHPAETLLTQDASEFISSYEFRRVMTGLAVLHGNAYASIDRVDGMPVALTIWNPLNTIVRVVAGRIWYATYINQKPVRVPAENMLHIRGLGSDGFTGLPVLDLMAEALGVGMAAMRFGARFFGAGSNMSGLLMVPGHFSEEKIRNTIQAWNSMQSGLNHSHKIALLQDGVKFQQLQITPEQSQFLQTREHEVRATVSNITGVPPHMLGDATRTSHNSLESEGQSYLDYTLQPWLKTWESECEKKLLTQKQRDNDTHIIEFNREALVQMTFDSKINGIYRQLESGLISHNEGRAFLNMPSIGDDGDKRYRPANWMEIGDEEDAAAVAPQDDNMDSGDDSNVAAVTLRAMIASGVTKATELESSKLIRMANSRAGQFLASVDEFYETWTENTLQGCDSESVRDAIALHAEASKAAVLDVAGVSTTDSLKSNVTDLVVTWDRRRDELINTIWKQVSKCGRKSR